MNLRKSLVAVCAVLGLAAGVDVVTDIVAGPTVAIGDVAEADNVRFPPTVAASSDAGPDDGIGTMPSISGTSPPAEGITTTPSLSVDVRDDGAGAVPDAVSDPGGALGVIREGWRRSWFLGVLLTLIVGSVTIQRRTKPGTRTATIASGVTVAVAAILAMVTDEASWQQGGSAIAIAIGYALNPFGRPRPESK